jgi:hypothetical protein
MSTQRTSEPTLPRIHVQLVAELGDLLMVTRQLNHLPALLAAELDLVDDALGRLDRAIMASHDRHELRGCLARGASLDLFELHTVRDRLHRQDLSGTSLRLAHIRRRVAARAMELAAPRA